MTPTPRRIRLRYPAVCADCETSLTPGTTAWWDGEAREARCLEHADLENTEAESTPPVVVSAESDQLHRPDAEPPVEVEPGFEEGEAGPEAADETRLDVGLAGASAQREFDRRRTTREERIRTKHRRLGGLILALTQEPQSTRAWETGADGERELCKRLDQAAERGVIALHDRRIPGSKANIDHIAIGPGGVFVIDAKKYTGKVEKRDVGGFFRKDERLYVGRRDRSKLLEGMHKQVEVVRTTLVAVDEGAGIPVTGMLCFVKAEWPLFGRPMQLDGVVVIWPKALADAFTRETILSPEQTQTIALHLGKVLLPA